MAWCTFSCFAHNLCNYACMDSHQLYVMVHMKVSKVTDYNKEKMVHALIAGH